MSPTIPSESCEIHAREISAFLDGELPFPESLPAVDHLASCEGCRRFYREARGLSERLAEVPAPPAPDELWERIAGPGAAAPPSPVRRRISPRTIRLAGLAAAAVLVAAFGLTQWRSLTPPPGKSATTVPSALREIVVEGARGRMTDERFLSLIAELLSADKKYHRETERVLRFVLRQEGSGALEDPKATPTEELETGDGESGSRTPRKSSPLPS